MFPANRFAIDTRGQLRFIVDGLDTPHPVGLSTPYDPQYPYGPDGPSIGEALEMTLAVFEVSEGVEVDFVDDPR